MSTDTRFFTNEEGNSLLARFRETLPGTRFFDVLSGYFRSSGFGLIADALGNVEKMRILVGMETEQAVVDAVAEGELETAILPSHAEIRDEYSREVQRELERAPESQATEDSISRFIEFIRAGKVEIRGHPSRDIHAKVYISRYFAMEFGSVVTGSSNFTNPGLTARREFNVQLKDEPDVRFALARFEKLWEESVDLSEEFVRTATRKTWLNDAISPYELYLKFLYEYFKEEIADTEEIAALLPENFLNLEYQRQAVAAARKMLDAHNGVFLSDVVGLGKTYIASMLLQGLPGHKLVICPPVLKPYWEDALRSFFVPACKVVSSGNLAEITDYGKYSYVVVDESHRFRNEKTQSYEILKKICLGKKVVLLSATPLNNRLEDLLAQLKLFQKGRDSTIPGVANLEAFFRQQTKALTGLAPTEVKAQTSRIAALVRDKVLKHVMIRRTRKEVSRYFSDDMEKNGLKFPEVENPDPLLYEFDPALDAAFNQTITLLRSLTYARYAPLLFLTAEISQIDVLSQNNIKGFIKSLLVKRLESSFFAFGLSIARMIRSYEAFIEAFKAGKVYVGRQVDIGAVLDSDDLEEMEERLEQKGVEIYAADDFSPKLLLDLEKDLEVFQTIASIWANIAADPKYEAFFKNIIGNPALKGERVLVFTESRETGEYLYGRLEKALPGKAAMFSSSKAFYNGRALSSREARELVRRNFDPGHEEAADDFRILITTDVLAEGMNLHRAGRIINYDLPWNPTRMMQRLGRINRVGSEHATLRIFNFFPTAQADAHLGLQENIARKITAFNTVLGNDNKILFEEENPDPHGLFRRLTSFNEEEDEDSELEYLREIREIRDNNPRLFEKIKTLPPKARSAYASASGSDELLVFFRQGALKKFVACGKETRELGFLEAAPIMRAAPDVKRAKLPHDYYGRLNAAKNFLEDDGAAVEAPIRVSVQNRQLLENLAYLRNLSVLTEDEREYLTLLYKAVVESALAKKSVKRLTDICKAYHPSPLRLFNALCAALPPADLLALRSLDAVQPQKNRKPKQIVLCQYIISAKEVSSCLTN